MKRTIYLSLASFSGAAVLFLSRVAATEPDPSLTSSPQVSSAEESPSTPGEPGKFGKSHKFDGLRRGFHRSSRHHFGRHRDPGALLDRLLNLTDEQEAKVKEIMKATKPKVQAIREEQRAKIEAVMEDARRQIRPLLTPAQQKVFDDAQKLREDARRLRDEARALRREKGKDPSE
jgi:Spy/CpxP family protein refolding chaperone